MDLQGLRQWPGARRVIRGPLPAGRLRLSLLMFLLYTAPGAVVPIFSLRLKELGFSATEIGWCCATQAIGTMLAPLLAGHIADRWLAAERCLAALSFVAAGVLWLLASLTTPAAIFAANLLLWLLVAPALTLATSVCFAHLGEARHDFGRVRMWGTVGWVAPGWLLGFWLAKREGWAGTAAPELADAFRLGAVLAVMFGLFALSLPHTPPQRGGGGVAPLAALRLLRGRAFFVYAACTLGIAAALPFSSQVTPLLLEHVGVSKPWIPRLLTLAQASEILSLLLLPRVLSRYGVRGTMRLGLAAAAVTLAGLAAGRPLGLVLAGFGLYGLCIGCYLVAGQMYLNQRTRADLRASSQALHSVLCGAGLLIGNVLVGLVRDWADGSFPATFIVGATMALGLLVIFAVSFPRVPAHEELGGSESPDLRSRQSKPAESPILPSPPGFAGGEG